jgi:hypothetical protein
MRERAPPSAATPIGVVLEFEILSGKMVDVQSMNTSASAASYRLGAAASAISNLATPGQNVASLNRAKAWLRRALCALSIAARSVHWRRVDERS